MNKFELYLKYIKENFKIKLIYYAFYTLNLND